MYLLKPILEIFSECHGAGLFPSFRFLGFQLQLGIFQLGLFAATFKNNEVSYFTALFVPPL